MDHNTKTPNPSKATGDGNTVNELANSPSSTTETGARANERPGAYHVVYYTSQPPLDADHDIMDDSEASQQSVVAVDDAEVYNEEAEQLRLVQAIQEAREAGHQEGLQELASNAVPAIPVEVKRGEEENAHCPRIYPTFHIIVGVMLVAVLVVAVVTIVAHHNRTSSASVSPTRQVQCFENETVLQAAVDAYLESVLSNSSFGLVYGYSITHWCVSRIRAFDELFSAVRNPLANYFDGNLSGWDVSNAASMARMFYQARKFRGFGLESWNVSWLQNASGMFNGSRIFDGDLSGWDVSHVTNMSGMFLDATLFDGNLSRWDMSKVVSMNSMFANAANFSGMGLGHWNVSKVVDMAAMFSGASSFDNNLSKWDVSQVRNMSTMFTYATKFSGIGLHYWNVSNVIDMTGMFWEASTFDSNVSTWDVSKVRTIDGMFTYATNFTGIGLDCWNVSSVVDMVNMFWSASSFDANLSMWDVSQVSNMNSMFADATNFTGIGLDRWNVSSVIDMGNMFWDASAFDANLSMWEVTSVQSMDSVFGNANSFTGIGVERWNVSSVTYMGYMFGGASSFDADLSQWDVSRDTCMCDMFRDATSFLGHGVDKWKTGKVEKMLKMFLGASSFNANLSGWDVSQVWDMSYMFANASKFTGIGLEHWDVSKVNDTVEMFRGAASFNNNLCGWGNLVRLVDANTTLMFAGTLCPLDASPNLNLKQPSPFCYKC